MPKFIAFGHRSRHGKDTCARLVDTELRIKCPGKKIKVVSFAQKLKEVTYDMFKWAGVRPPIDYENDPNLRNVPIEDVGGLTVVDLWVLVGEKMREIFPLIWVNNVLRAYNDFDIIIIPDLRHPNEVDALREYVSELVKVTRSGVPDREGHSIDDMLADFTEWNCHIENDGTLRELNTTCVALADEVIEKWGINE